mmetsp:Transcript_54821/g.128712  ORF Transcript_54821/g.128712 Transcript_54821/m.128712 type:complete len:94 (+) Transcript_54821:130-411(+)
MRNAILASVNFPALGESGQRAHFDSAWLGSRWLEAYHRAAIEGVVYAVFGARLGVDNYAVEIVRPTKLPGVNMVSCSEVRFADAMDSSCIHHR